MRCLAIFLSAAMFTTVLAQEGPPPVLVKTAEIQQMEFHEELILVGRTEARRESRIVAETAGRVRSIPASEGREVKRGAALVTIDCRRLELALEAKTAEAAQAEADAELARKELQRARDLVKTEVFPERNLDSAVADDARTAERFRQLEAERRQLKLDRENCTIRAPYNGFTIRKLVDVGEWVEIGAPVYELVDLEVVKITADLPERRFGQVKIGNPVRIAVAGNGDAPLIGEVTGIAPRASETTHTFPVIIEVDNRQASLGSGMLVRVTLTMPQTLQSLAVTKDAIIRQGERSVVFRVIDGTAQAVTVRPLATQGEMVAISGDGLAAGQEVIVRGNERIFDGDAVQVDVGNGPGPEV